MRTRTAVALVALGCAMPALSWGQNPSLTVSASPASGPATTLHMAVSDARGYDANSTAQMLISWDGGGVDACYVIYNIQANALYLMDDTGSTLLGGVAGGAVRRSPS